MKVLILLSVMCGVFGIGWKQKYAVKMNLRCGNEPATDIRVRLMDKDTLDPDDELADKRTNNQGFVKLEGRESEMTDIDPYLEIYHDCNDVEQKTGLPKADKRGCALKLCQRKWKLKLPDLYINKGIMDLGTMNLEMRLKDEDRDCIN